MAIYPCDWSAHRYPDAQQSAYVIWACGGAVGGNALRLCPKHFREVLSACRDKLALVEDDSQSSLTCEMCGADRDGTFMVKCFPAKQEQEDYAADLCVGCSETLGAVLRASNGRPLRASVQAV